MWKGFDAAVGDTGFGFGFTKMVWRKRNTEVTWSSQLSPDFTMVVHEKPTGLNKFWWFLSPFTTELWLTLLSLTLFTGFVFWIIERQNEDGPSLIQALLFFLQRASPRNSLTYFVLAPWSLLVLVLIATYTSILTSMITSSETESEPSCLLMENFKIKNDRIGCDGDSIIFPYLVEILGFEKENIKNISQSSIDDYEKALSSGNIKAAFFSTHYADLFLAKYNKGFTAWEPIRNLYGSAVVFPRGSPFLREMSQLKEMQLRFNNCTVNHDHSYDNKTLLGELLDSGNVDGQRFLDVAHNFVFSKPEEK
ncbi:Ionotropic glutamate receptor [Corchorus olitorius]|uniref:Ionotropic glutamate receptor n=1 Tax=Corchorus olitorius TaxID=93759 RepID=A0A1R3K4L5_9ROSI|nr:Ionotropic glutamate receptor [Corchorus olitorius]